VAQLPIVELLTNRTLSTYSIRDYSHRLLACIDSHRSGVYHSAFSDS
jgi:hypothetical protein